MPEPTTDATDVNAEAQVPVQAAPAPGTGPRIISTPEQDPPAEAVVPPEGDDELADDDTPGTQAESALRREAAKHRVRAQAAEAERDALRERVEGFERATVDALAVDRLANPADLWLVSSLDAMRAEDGTVDPALAEAEIDRVLTDRPYWKPVAHPDFHGGVRGVPGSPPPSFGQMVKDATNR